MKKQYNIIGDIHCRVGWERLVDPTRINIFLGDYFDPYEDYDFTRQSTNFLNIINFVKIHPDTILLLGNHDLHYIHHDDHSRYNQTHEDDIIMLFMSNMHLFHGVAYAIEDDILVSHAGFTEEWCKSSGYVGDRSLQSLADHANNLFWDGYVEQSNGVRYWDNPLRHGMREFTFRAHAKFSDYYGASSGQSPVWIRPSTLIYSSVRPDKDQIVGHTQRYTIIPYAEDNLFEVIDWKNHEEEIKHPGGRMIMVDVLGQALESLFIDYNGPGDYKYIVNKPYITHE